MPAPQRRVPDADDSRAARRAALRGCLGRFATGVAVITFDGPRGRRGITVNSFASVSLEPPLVQVNIAKRALSHDALRGNDFCVNVLGAEQEALARHFAGGAPASPQWIEGRVPRLAGTLAYLVCAPWRAYDGGDHTLFLGEVLDFGHRGGDALGYVNSRFTVIAEEDLGVEYLI